MSPGGVGNGGESSMVARKRNHHTYERRDMLPSFGERSERQTTSEKVQINCRINEPGERCTAEVLIPTKKGERDVSRMANR